MNCPACNLVCETESYDGVSICVCSKCKGVWLDQAQVKHIVSTRERGFKLNEVDAINRLCGISEKSKESESRGLPCPVCGKASMNTRQFGYSSGVLVDTCAQQCGTWIDADELEKIQIHCELWQDKLEASRGRFSSLARQVDENSRHVINQIETAIAPSRYRFVNAMLTGLVRFF